MAGYNTCYSIVFLVAECAVLQAPAHGFLNCSHPFGTFAWSSSCEFACEDGFLLKGSNQLQCGASGNWDGQKPECEGNNICVIVLPAQTEFMVPFLGMISLQLTRIEELQSVSASVGKSEARWELTVSLCTAFLLLFMV